jgi:hypothetical protein
MRPKATLHALRVGELLFLAPRLGDDVLGGAVAPCGDDLEGPAAPQGLVVGDGRTWWQRLSGEPGEEVFLDLSDDAFDVSALILRPKR